VHICLLTEKLKEFNKQLDAPCAESNLNSLAELCQLEKTPPVETLQALRELMSSWPDGEEGSKFEFELCYDRGNLTDEEFSRFEFTCN